MQSAIDPVLISVGETHEFEHSGGMKSHKTTIRYGHDNPGNVIAFTYGHYPAFNSELFARRLTACWNACEGVPTEMLEKNTSRVKVWVESLENIGLGNTDPDTMVACACTALAKPAPTSAGQPDVVVSNHTLRSLLNDADQLIASMIEGEESFYDEDCKLRALRARIKAALDGTCAHNHVSDLIWSLNGAIARVELANSEGDPILSAWLPDAKSNLANAKAFLANIENSDNTQCLHETAFQPTVMLKPRVVIDMANKAFQDGKRQDNDLAYIEVAIAVIAEFCRLNKIPLNITSENAPVGTKAPSITGGAWVRTLRGWTWNGHTRSPGSTFPRPGGIGTVAC